MRPQLILMVAFALWPATANAIPAVESDVSSFAEYGVSPGQRYFLAASEKSRNDTLEFSSYAKHVEKALASKQMVRVAAPAEAQIIIFLDYGMGAPQKQIGSYTLPTFGQTGVSGATTYGQVSSTGTVSATTTYTPSFGITGATTNVYNYTTFDRWMRLAAHSLTDESEKAIWLTEVKSNGSTGDLRRIFPIMLFASLKYIGTDTGRAMKVKVKEKSKEFRAFIGN